MISNYDKERVLDNTDIVSLIGSFIDVKKKGNNFSACCPFHNEKTPSFLISPSKSFYKCFGCGASGNAISFLMNFKHLNYVEAVRELARRADITLEEKELSPEQQARETKREAMFLLTNKVNEFFCEQLSANPSAKAYADKRWGDQFVLDNGIGYAPKSSVFIDWFNNQHLNLELAKELHLIGTNDKGGLYAQFRERITIPIRSRANQINGWSCRDISNRDDSPKYINSSDSELYSKRLSLFGMDMARHEIRATGKAYIAEGAPDVLRMQCLGIYNAVAPLGTGTMGKEQFDLLESFYPKMGNKAICLLPDADMTKADGSNPGKETAIRIGKEACNRGFIVTIKIIPEGADKQDPDSFYTTKKKFTEIQEQDFILWYAKLLAETALNVEATNEMVREVSMLVANCNDEVREQSYIKSLKNEVYKEAAVWSKAVKEAHNSIKQKSFEEKAFSKEGFVRYGFYEIDNCYYSLQGATEIRWSNFTMKPLFHIKDAINPKRLYTVKNETGNSEIVELKQEDLVSLAKFRQRIEGLGNYIFEAGEQQLIKLKRYLYEQTETATEVVQLGWQKQGFWAWGNGALYQGSFSKADKYGIIRLSQDGNLYLPGASEIYKNDTLFQFEKRFVHLGYSTVQLNEVAVTMIKVFGDNAKIGICFLIATLFRDIITSCVKAFPLLNLFGPKGSGKSELGHSLMSFFIIQNIPPNLTNSTIAALSEAVAQCSNALVHLDEFKNNIDIEKREFLKGLWDSAGRTRMNMDRDKKREQTKVDAGVIVSGQEMATADIALFSRFIYLTFNKTEFTTEENNNFDELDRLRKLGFSHLTMQILNYREQFKQNFQHEYNAVSSDIMNKLGNEICESRIINNWATVAAAFRSIENCIDLPFSYGDILNICVAGIIRQNKECKSNNEIASFWSVIAFLQQEGQLVMDSDYKIDYSKYLKTTKASIEFQDVTPILMLRRGKAFQLYKRFAKQCGENPLPEGSLKYYLENSKEFLGIKQSVRFKTTINGRDIQIEDKLSGSTVNASQIDMALCFNYNLLMANHEINLEIDAALPNNLEEQLPY